jgi:anthraniloyl-CoA monooxygenase
MVWFENAAQHMHLTPLELAFTLMTRSGRVTYDDLKRRDPIFIQDYESARDQR